MNKRHSPQIVQPSYDSIMIPLCVPTDKSVGYFLVSVSRTASLQWSYRIPPGRSAGPLVRNDVFAKDRQGTALGHEPQLHLGVLPRTYEVSLYPIGSDTEIC